MRLLLPLFVTVLATASVSLADAPAPTDASVDPVLQQLEQVGKSLREFSGRIKLIETDNTLLQETIRVGNVWYQKRPDGSARIRVLLDRRLSEDQKHASPEKIEYVLDGPWLIDRNYQTRNEVRRQVLKPGQKMDLFKLGEGPFPMPIGQNPQDVHRLFGVKLVPPTKDDPANTVHLQLTPKPETELARKFAAIDVWVDQKTHMPARIDTLDVKKQTTRSTELKDIVVNPQKGLGDADFALPNIDNDHWNRHVESLD
jgi:outer membrane lipoprotein-sorting protein